MPNLRRAPRRTREPLWGGSRQRTASGLDGDLRAYRAVVVTRTRSSSGGLSTQGYSEGLMPSTKYSVSPKQELGTHLCWAYCKATRLPIEALIWAATASLGTVK